MSRTSMHATHDLADASTLRNYSTGTDFLSQMFSLEENLNACLTISLKELEDRFTPYPAMREPWHSLKAFLRKRGKRVRPMLFLFSYQLFDRKSETPPMAAYRVAAALEIFHAFALIHDDIIDASHSRRGAPTLHKRLEAETGIDARQAENLALVLGDILFGFAMESFLDTGLCAQRAPRAMRFFLKVAQDTGLGQAVEIAHLSEALGEVSEDEILNTYFLKTTRYTIESPLILGAILSGAGHKVERALSAFASPLGLAFQIENDLHEIAELLEGDPDAAYDLHAGVKTLFLKRLHHSLRKPERKRLEGLLREGSMNDFSAIMQSPAAKAVALRLREDVGLYFEEARQALGASVLNRNQRTSLLAFVDFISLNSHHSESDNKVRAAYA